MEKRGFVLTIVLLFAAALILGNLQPADTGVDAQATRGTTFPTKDPNYPLLPQGSQQQSSGMQTGELRTCKCPIPISIPNGDTNNCGGKELDVCSSAKCTKRVWETGPDGQEIPRDIPYACEVHEICNKVPSPCNQESFQDYIRYDPYETWRSTCTRTKTCPGSAKDCARATCTFHCVSDATNKQGTGPLFEANLRYPCGQ